MNRKDLPRDFPHANNPQPMCDGTYWIEAKDDPWRDAKPRTTALDWLVWGFLIAVAVFLAVAFWQAWGSQ